jgi:pimeloyl-ACP methyl ester carboxylesterase
MNMEEFGCSCPDLELAGVLALALGKTTPLPLRPRDEALLANTVEFRFGANQSRLGWTIGKGPVVLLVHGYSGRGVQMATLAREIAKCGFRAVFFDAGGHGASRAEKVGFFTFINDTRDIVAHLGEPLFAMIGHSAGGLAMMRARGLYGAKAGRYVLIAAPFYPYVPLETMQRQGAPAETIPHIKAILSDQFQTTWAALVGGIAFDPEPDARLLAIYDTADERVRHSDAELIGSRWPGTHVVKTSGYGHNRILQADETLKAVAKFLTSNG